MLWIQTARNQFHSKMMTLFLDKKAQANSVGLINWLRQPGQIRNAL